jgi:hypothetical protein
MAALFPFLILSHPGSRIPNDWFAVFLAWMAAGRLFDGID